MAGSDSSSGAALKSSRQTSEQASAKGSLIARSSIHVITSLSVDVTGKLRHVDAAGSTRTRATHHRDSMSVVEGQVLTRTMLRAGSPTAFSIGECSPL